MCIIYFHVPSYVNGLIYTTGIFLSGNKGFKNEIINYTFAFNYIFHSCRWDMRISHLKNCAVLIEYCCHKQTFFMHPRHSGMHIGIDSYLLIVLSRFFFFFADMFPNEDSEICQSVCNCS